MNNEELKSALTAVNPNVTFDETSEFMQAFVAPADFRKFMKAIRNNADLEFDFLFCLTCIDWKTNLTMVYHLLSKKHRHQLVVKVKLDDVNNPILETVCDIWKTANFHEREVYDLFGVKFNNHPDLRRILLDDEWEGYPLRKNYVDENMISL